MAKRASAQGAHVARAALMYLHNQADQGTSCPLTMTYAVRAGAEQQPELAREWLPRVIAPTYDARGRAGAGRSAATRSAWG